MGGEPLFALNLVAWPKDKLPLELLNQVLSGGQRAADNGDWVVAGGHTVDGPEPMYGMSVLGEVDPEDLLTNQGGQSGETLVLTKPIGTGRGDSRNPRQGLRSDRCHRVRLTGSPSRTNDGKRSYGHR